MIVIDLTPLDVALLAAGFSALLALVFLWIARAQLRSEIAAVARRAAPADVAYQRFVASSAALTRWFIIAVLVVAILGVVADVQVPADELSGAVAWAAFFGALGSLLLPLVVYNLVSAPLVTVPALRDLRGLRVGAGEITTLRLKQSVAFYSPLLLVSAAGLLVSADGPLAVLLSVAALACYVLLALFGAHVIRWQVRTTPLERSEWAALAPRVAEWQRRAGVRLRDVRVQHTGRLGYANVQVAGTLDRTLLLSDAFLAQSDWRQRDALVAWAIGYTRRGSGRRMQSGRATFFVLVAALALLSVTLPLLMPDLDPTLVGVLPFLFLVPALIVLAARPRRRVSHLVAAADSYAAWLSGDPLALIVALNTLNAINGLSPQRALGRHPSLASRVVALAQLARQPGPRAPFAAQPVPSAVPIALDGRLVTVPLDQAPPAAHAPAPPGTMAAVAAR